MRFQSKPQNKYLSSAQRYMLYWNPLCFLSSNQYIFISRESLNFNNIGLFAVVQTSSQVK